MPKYSTETKPSFFSEEDKRKIESRIGFLSKIYSRTDLTEKKLTKVIESSLNKSTSSKKELELMSAQFFRGYLQPEKHPEKIESEFDLGHLKTRSQKNQAYAFIKNKTQENLTKLKQNLKENPTKRNNFFNFTSI